MFYELRKWSNLKSITIIIFALILNIFLFHQHFRHKDRHILEDYNTYVEVLKDLKSSDQNKEISNPQEGGLPSSSALNALAQQQNYIKSYPDYILGTPDRAEDAFALSGKEITIYNQRNIEKTVKDFAGLESLPLEIGYDLQVTRPFDFQFSDLILFAFIILLTTQMFTQEYEEELFPLLTATQSRIRLGISKISAIIFTLLLLCLGLYGGNIITAGFIYGWDDLNRLVQSISDFRSLIYPMTVAVYFVLALLIKWINAVTVALIIFALYTLLKRAIPVLSIVAGFWIMFYILSISIPVNSVFNILHFVNPIYGFYSFDLIRRYQNINIFNHPVEMIILWPILCLIFITVSIIIIIQRFSTAKILHNKSSSRYLSKIKDNFIRLTDKINSRGGIFFNELKKVLFSDKGLLVLLILIGLLYHRIDTAYRYKDSKQQAYAYYIEVFQGKVSETTLEEIAAERNNLLSNNRHDLVEIELNALDRVEKQLKKVLEIEAQRGIPAHLINDDTYAQWLDNPRADLRDIITTFLAAIFFSSGIFARENSIDAKRLLRITPENRKLRRYKFLITILFTLAISALVQITRVIEFNKFDQLKDLHVPVQNHSAWRNFPSLWTMQTYLIVMYVFRFIASISLASIIAAISARSKNTSISVVITTIITVLPALAMFANIREMQLFSLAWLAEVNNLMLHDKIYWVISVLIHITIIGLCIWSIKLEWQPQKFSSKRMK